MLKVTQAVAGRNPGTELDVVFKAYDIRGLVPEQLDAELCRAIGAAFARFAAAPRLLVGHDMRQSGEELVAAFCDDARREGATVTLLGLASTDLVYYAAGKLASPAAMITASHNPARYNGIKLCLAGASPVGLDTGLSDIKEMAGAIRDGRIALTRQPVGGVESLDLLDDFADHVVSFVDRSLLKPLKVIADTANGMGGLVVPKVFERVPFDLDVMYGELDGTFPNHPADPIQPANQRDLQARVTATGADVGLAFDGDADRVFLVDETGDGLSGSTTTAILASGTTCRPSSVDRASRLIGCVATGKRRPPTRRGCSSPKPTPLRSTCVLRLIHGPVGANGATGTATRTGRYPIRSRCSGSASMSLRKVGALPRRWLRDIVALLAPPTTSAVGDRWCMPSRLRPATVTVTSSPEVDDSPTDELRLVLVMKDI